MRRFLRRDQALLRQMRRGWLVLAVCLSALLLGTMAPGGMVQGAVLAQPTNLAAVHHSGQTFITWTEAAGGGAGAPHYRVYRHTQPITAANLTQARLLAEVATGSGRFYANRYPVGGGGTWAPRYYDSLVIANRAAPLASGTGLLVWTVAADDFGGGSSGQGYYAVTTVAGGVEDRSSFTAANTTGPLAETVADPLPVEIAPPGLASNGRIYIQYMDLHTWNTTFHAPNAGNGYYGLDPADPGVADGAQYMYDYAVYMPTAADCGGTLPPRLPVYVALHGWGGNTYGPQLDDPDPFGWCVYRIYPIDVSETWYFGFAQEHDYRTDTPVADGGHIANFTEQRILRMVYDLLRQPPGPPADANRVYVYGHSMGGSGTLALALRYPNVFAAAYASEPMTNYATSGDGGGTDWRGDYAGKWGNVGQNLPVILRAPGSWGAPLAAYQGTGVYSWQNHQANLTGRAEDGFVPLGIGHGLNDTVIEWNTQGQPAYAALNSAAGAWGGAVVDADHTWLSFAGLPPTLSSASSLSPFQNFTVIRSETVPGLSNNSSGLPIPPAAAGGYNQNVRWSASWDAWDGAPVDTATQWAMSLCYKDPDPYAADCGTGTPLTVDITPRRVQQFPLVAGAEYTWENRRVVGGSLVASGIVTANGGRRVTVPAFQLEAPGGNRLILRPRNPLTVTPTATPTATPTIVPTTGPTPGEHPVYLPHTLKSNAPPATPTPTATPISTSVPTPTPTATAVPTLTGTPGARVWPDTTNGIHIFNDQLDTNLSEAQWIFAATRYAGTQKMVRSDADRLRAINPAFLILHCRLGPGLGYRTIQGTCSPSGGYIHIVEGDNWVQEWPAPSALRDEWFYTLPGSGQPRVLNCDWGWYLMDLSNSSWRTFWQGEALRQMGANDDDGIFLDSLSVPNYLGADHYVPALPDVDAPFETAWAQRIDNWLAWLQTQPLGAYAILPNAGAWITTRDPTTYAAADGVMIEDFASWGDGSAFAREDWELQMNRVLGLASQGKIIIAQSYVTAAEDRMFALGSYLLTKGSHSFLNLELDAPPEWWPEYAIAIGTPLQPTPATIGVLAQGSLYRRSYSNGFVLLNAADSGAPVTVPLGGTYNRVDPVGGGEVPVDGTAPGSLTYTAVSEVMLPPNTAVVLLNR